MRKNWLSLLACAGLLSAGFVLSSARGAEPKCDCPAAQTKCEVGVPLLSKLPYLSRLFKNVGAACEEHCADQAFERIGIDFDVDCHCPEAAGQPLRFECFELRLHPTAIGGECQKAGCQAAACACPGTVCQVSACQECVKKCPACTDCCCTEKGCGKSCGAAQACCAKGECPAKCVASCACGTKCVCAGSGSGKTDVALWHHLVELAAAKAGAEAALAAHEDSAELLDSLVELSAENAKLAAQVEAQEREHEFFDELLELAKENASLKAKVELAAAQTELLKQTFGVALENERLKLRIAHLEGHHGSEGPAHTAAKPSEQQPAR